MKYATRYVRRLPLAGNRAASQNPLKLSWQKSNLKNGKQPSMYAFGHYPTLPERPSKQHAVSIPGYRTDEVVDVTKASAASPYAEPLSYKPGMSNRADDKATWRRCVESTASRCARALYTSNHPIATQSPPHILRACGGTPINGI